MYKRQIYQIAELNRVKKNRFDSENRIESNRNFFCPNWNALVLTCTFTLPLSGLKLAFSQIIPSLLSSGLSPRTFHFWACLFFGFRFYPRRATPTLCQPSAATSYGPVSVCLSVCLSVSVTRCSIETDGRILARRLLSTSPALCYKKILVSTKNEGTSLWNVILNSGLEKVATSYRSSARVINLTRERWTLRGQTKPSSVN